MSKPENFTSLFGKPIKEIKIYPCYFEEVASGRKRAELRKNDRNYQPGEIYRMREYDGYKYTGRSVLVYITHVLKNCTGLKDGFCIFSFGVIC